MLGTGVGGKLQPRSSSGTCASLIGGEAHISTSMLKHVKNSMYDSNFFGVVEVVKRHARMADTLFFQT